MVFCIAVFYQYTRQHYCDVVTAPCFAVHATTASLHVRTVAAVAGRSVGLPNTALRALQIVHEALVKHKVPWNGKQYHPVKVHMEALKEVYPRSSIAVHEVQDLVLKAGTKLSGALVNVPNSLTMDCLLQFAECFEEWKNKPPPPPSREVVPQVRPPYMGINDGDGLTLRCPQPPACLLTVVLVSSQAESTFALFHRCI